MKQAAECVREADIATAQGILDAVGVTLPTGRMEDGGYDENGNLYRIPETIMSDPTNLVDEDGDDQTVVGTAESKEVTKVVDDENEPKEIATEPTQQDKGKAAVDKDAMKVKCRLSDRGGPDVVILLGRSQTVGVLCRRVRDEGDVSAAFTACITANKIPGAFSRQSANCISGNDPERQTNPLGARLERRSCCQCAHYRRVLPISGLYRRRGYLGRGDCTELRKDIFDDHSTDCLIT